MDGEKKNEGKAQTKESALSDPRETVKALEIKLNRSAGWTRCPDLVDMHHLFRAAPPMLPPLGNAHESQEE
ncbi:MAG: hypothetical protein KDD55_10045 [Bdellovibrionales bacterium]|nr:hypothetical protein [Bdellovibrionales bacterium]